MTETDAIASAEGRIRHVLEEADSPLSSRELGERLSGEPQKSLIRIAIQRMIGRGTITYDRERRYSLHTPPTQT